MASYIFMQIKDDLSVTKPGKVQKLKRNFGNGTACKCTGQKAGKSESCSSGAPLTGSSGMEQELHQGEEETEHWEHSPIASNLPGENRRRSS